MKALDTVLQNEPNNHDALLMQARLYRSEEIHEEACRLYERLFKLTQKEAEIIVYLKNSKKPASISKLQKQVWSHNSELETHTVETHVYRLRKKIFDTFEDNSFISSNNYGYKIN